MMKQIIYNIFVEGYILGTILGTISYIILLVGKYQQSICGKLMATYESIFNGVEYVLS